MQHGDMKYQDRQTSASTSTAGALLFWLVARISSAITGFLSLGAIKTKENCSLQRSVIRVLYAKQPNKNKAENHGEWKLIGLL